MKKHLLIAVVSAIVLCSCATKMYYQVYDTKSVENQRTQDENCSIAYDFWEDRGNSGFYFFNNSDKFITIDKNKSFFIINGSAMCFYTGRTNKSGYTYTTNVSNSFSSGSSTNAQSHTYITTTQRSKSSSGSTSYQEKDKIIIPPHSHLSLIGFSIAENIYRGCDLLFRPTSKDTMGVVFTKEQSPMVFGNCITYTIDGSDKEYHLRDSFYISKIRNIPDYEIGEYYIYESCGKKEAVWVNNFMASNRFYIKYNPAHYAPFIDPNAKK